MRYKKPSIAALSIGIVLVVCSFVVKPLLDSAPGYTDEMGRQYEDATMRVHELSYRYGVPSKRYRYARGGATRTEAQEHEDLMLAEREYDRLRSRLDAARWRGRKWSRILRSIGSIFLIAGIVGYGVGRMRGGGLDRRP